MAPVVSTLPGGATIGFDWSRSGSVRLVVSGEIDAADAPALRRMSTSGRRFASVDVHVDASSLRFIDAAGARALRNFAEALSAAGSVDTVGMSPAAALVWNATAVSPPRPDPRPAVPMDGRAA